MNKQFIHEFAVYAVEANLSGYDVSRENCVELLKIATKYDCVVELLWLLQYNYEDCTTIEEWEEGLQ